MTARATWTPTSSHCSGFRPETCERLDLRKRGRETAAGAANGGNQSAEKSDNHRAGQRIENDASVEMDLFDAGKLRGERAEDAGRCRREKETKARADESEEKSFGEQLSNERAARCAQGEANGDFVLSLCRARQEAGRQCSCRRSAEAGRRSRRVTRENGASWQR